MRTEWIDRQTHQVIYKSKTNLTDLRRCFLWKVRSDSSSFPDAAGAGPSNRAARQGCWRHCLDRHCLLRNRDGAKENICSLPRNNKWDLIFFFVPSSLHRNSRYSSRHPRCAPTIVTPLSAIIPPLQLLFNSIVLPGTRELPIHTPIESKQIESYIRRIGRSLEDEFNGVQWTLYHIYFVSIFTGAIKTFRSIHIKKSTFATKVFSIFLRIRQLMIGVRLWLKCASRLINFILLYLFIYWILPTSIAT